MIRYSSERSSVVMEVGWQIVLKWNVGWGRCLDEGREHLLAGAEILQETHLPPDARRARKQVNVARDGGDRPMTRVKDRTRRAGHSELTRILLMSSTH